MDAAGKRTLGCWAAAITAVLLLVGGCNLVLGSRSLGNSQALARFQRHISPEVPASLTNLKLWGHSGLGDTVLHFRFIIGSNDLVTLIENSRFEPMEPRRIKEDRWVGDAMAQLTNPAVFVRNGNVPHDTVIMVADTNRTSVIVRYFCP